MTLAQDHRVIVGSEAISLRPTLRAALRLDREHGLPALLAGVLEGRLAIVSAIIREATGREITLDDLATPGLGQCLADLTEPLLALLCDLYGLDPRGEPAPAAKAGPAVKPADAFAKLFGLATGWLGWSAADAWNAAPAEIVAAYEARLDMLRAIFGGASDEAGPDLSPLDRDGLAALRNL